MFIFWFGSFGYCCLMDCMCCCCFYSLLLLLRTGAVVILWWIFFFFFSKYILYYLIRSLFSALRFSTKHDWQLLPFSYMALKTSVKLVLNETHTRTVYLLERVHIFNRVRRGFNILIMANVHGIRADFALQIAHLNAPESTHNFYIMYTYILYWMLHRKCGT